MNLCNNAPPVLVIDKNTGLYSSLIKAFTGVEIRIETGHSGEEGMKHLLHENYAAVLIGEDIGNENRFEIAKSIHCHTQTRSVPVLFLTSRSLSAREKSEAYAAGVIDFIDTPIAPQTVRCKIGLFIDLYDKQRALTCLNQELEQEKKRSDAANIAKSQFLANMSHEIRTPLNGIMGTAELLFLTNSDETQALYARTIIKSGETLLALINDILDLSKIEAGEMIIYREEIKPEDVVKDVLTSLSSRIEGKNIELAAIYETSLPDSFLLDPVRLRQILINLVGNAIKFVDNGHILVSVEHQNARNMSSLYFEIEDTGIGIPESKQETIFKKFTQADASTTKKYGGTGLGLSICKHLVEMMDGEIGVKSVPRSGAAFWFEIPAEVCRKENKHRQQTMEKIANKKILVASSSPNNRMLLSTVFENWEIDYRTASCGEKAIELIKKGLPFDIVLIDSALEDISPQKLVSLIKENPEYKKTQFILMGSAEQLRRTQHSAFTATLLKPLHSDDLLRCLAKEQKTAKTVRINTRPPPLLHSMKKASILLVEDDETNRMVACAMLENMGCTVDIACNGLQALQKLEKREYDVVLMDCMMPEMDGYAATRSVRQKEKNRNKKHQIVIAMTANAMKDDRAECLRAGMDDYITKPVKDADLRRLLTKYIQTLSPKETKGEEEQAQQAS